MFFKQKQSQNCFSLHVCFSDTNPRPWKVIVGKHQRYIKDDTEMVHTVSQIIPHEDYHPGTYENDIALMLLEVNIFYRKFT